MARDNNTDAAGCLAVLIGLLATVIVMESILIVFLIAKLSSL